MTDKNVCSYLHLNLPSSLLILFKGMRFGQMQVKTGLCHILSRFEVEPCKQTPVPITFKRSLSYCWWMETYRCLS